VVVVVVVVVGKERDVVDDQFKPRVELDFLVVCGSE